jgi:outer membrane protein assembly factor BamB
VSTWNETVRESQGIAIVQKMPFKKDSDMNKVMSLFWLLLVFNIIAAGSEKEEPQAAQIEKNSRSQRLPEAKNKITQTQLPASGIANKSAGCQWPRFHGPNRDNISGDTGLLKQWPINGPKLVWTAKDIGEGFSTVAIANGLIYTTGNIEKDTVITAMDLNGKLVWTANNGPAYKRSQPGTRGTPTIDNGRLYHENADGDVICLDAKTGEKIWSLNILEKFNGRNIIWGLAESLLIDGNNLICTPGGEAVGIAALDKRNGRTVWKSQGTHDKPGYCSPIVFEYKGLRQIVTLMAKSIAGFDAETGKLLWQVEHVTPYDENINMPIFHEGYIFASTRTTGSRLLRLNVDGKNASVEQVWESKQLEPQHGGILLLGNYLYGACRTSGLGPWVCLDFKTGKRMFSEQGIGTGSLTYADGLVYALNHKRIVALVEATPQQFKIISQFKLPEGGKGPTWAHPVVCNGCLYIRHGNHLYCYDIKND